MKRFRWLCCMLLGGIMCLSSCQSGLPHETDTPAVTFAETEALSENTETETEAETETEGETEAEVPVGIPGAITVSGDFSTVVDPSLLKKVAMYNAGCINPLSNYNRDIGRLTDLNTDALRIDLSIGKPDGTGSAQLVSRDYKTYDYDPATGKRKVDVGSLQYDFAQLDGIVRQMSALDVRPYMSWCYIPAPLQQDGRWNDLDQKVTNWQEVWEEVYYQYAKHYVDAGVKIGYHEIYNEPDLELLKCWGVFDRGFNGFLNWEDFCLGEQCNPAAGVYPDMYAYGVRGILRADPFATVGGPAFALGEIGVESWSGFLPRVLKDKLPLDFYSFHTYLDGNTWFMSDEERAQGGKNELEKVVAGLSSNEHFLYTAIHINEYSAQNDANGAREGLNSDFNHYRGAWLTFDGLMEAVERSSVQWIYWAQFMESTAGHEPYGLIEHVDGNIKAAYNAVKIYADMPVWRYESEISKPNSGLRSLVSSDGDKISVVIYNTNPADSGKGDREVNVVLSDAPFAEGVRRVYRIDGEHGSYFDKRSEAELKATEEEIIRTKGCVWSGVVPADGMVYITVNRNGEADFTAYAERTDFATDVKTAYYYEDRYRGLEGSREYYEDYAAGLSGSYAHYDRGTSTMYLGMGSATGREGKCVGQAHASGAVIFEDLPARFRVDIKTEGDIRMHTKNTTLGVRIDFYDEESDSYVKSVYFCYGDLYDPNRDPTAQDARTKRLPFYPWGTEKAPDEVVFCSGATWEVDLSQYAPEGWDAATDKAQISFDMQNTGAYTRAAITLRK